MYNYKTIKPVLSRTNPHCRVNHLHDKHQPGKGRVYILIHPLFFSPVFTISEVKSSPNLKSHDVLVVLPAFAQQAEGWVFESQSRQTSLKRVVTAPLPNARH